MLLKKEATPTIPSKIISVNDRMDDLHVSLEGDGTQVRDGRVEKHIDEPFAKEQDADGVPPVLPLHRVTSVIQFQGVWNDEGGTRQEIQEDLVLDEEQRRLRSELLVGQQSGQDHTIRKTTDHSGNHGETQGKNGARWRTLDPSAIRDRLVLRWTVAW